MAANLRKWISELMVFDGDDKSTVAEASEFLASYDIGGWSVDARGIHGIGELSNVLVDYCNIKQLSFCTHGFPGGVYFNGGSLSIWNLATVRIPPDLFIHQGRVLFMGCETARTQAGEDFLVAAGKHFLAGRGGVVGGATIYTLGFSSGARLPLFGRSSGGWASGKLILYQVNPAGNITARKAF